MRYLGDISDDGTVRGSFNTRTADGVPITLAGTPALRVYKDAGATESTAGVTLTVDFDSVTGLHLFTIDTSADAFYATGSDYRVVIAAGTVDGTSVAGSEVGSFSIQNRYMRGTDNANSIAPATQADVTAAQTALATAIDGKLTTERLTTIDNLPSAWPTNLNLLAIDGAGRITLNTTQMTELLSDDDIGAIATAIIASFNESSDVPIITQATATVDRLKADATFLALVADALAAKTTAEANSTAIGNLPAPMTQEEVAAAAASGVLATPANKLLTNAAGNVTTSNPATGGTGSAHTAADVAELILANPANKIATNATGQVSASNMRGTDDAATSGQLGATEQALATAVNDAAFDPALQTVTLSTAQFADLFSDADSSTKFGDFLDSLLENFDEDTDGASIAFATATVNRLLTNPTFVTLVANALAAKNAAEANSAEIAKVPKQNENRTWTIGGSDPSVIRIGAAE